MSGKPSRATTSEDHGILLGRSRKNKISSLADPANKGNPHASIATNDDDYGARQPNFDGHTIEINTLASNSRFKDKSRDTVGDHVQTIHDMDNSSIPRNDES